MMTEKDKRRAWADEQISLLVRQREGIDRKIREYQAFLTLLEQSDAAIAAPQTAKQAQKSNGHEKSLGSRIADVLESSLVPLTPRQIADDLVKLGFNPRAKTPLRVLVASEVYRQARLGKNGIRLAAPGRFEYSRPEME
jgi:hypothetical protein